MRLRLAPALGLALATSTLAHAQTATVAAADSPTPTPTLSPEDQKLLQEIEASQSSAKAPDAGSASAGTPAPARGSPASGLSNVYNPAMSVNGLFLGHADDRRDPKVPADESGSTIAVQEIEMQFLANVDPYFQANLILSSPGGVGIEVEEGTISPTWQPYGLSFRFGKIKEPFGRENALHTHALPFVDKSLVGNAIFTEEGLSEPSVEVSYLTPLPWYSLAYATVMNGDNPAFGSPRDRDVAGMVALKNVVDLSDDATVELQPSYAAGSNAFGKLAQVYGGDVIVKWRPARAASTRSAVIAAEALYAHEPAPPIPPATLKSSNVGGAYGYAQWQLAKRWFAAGRFDYLGFAARESGITRRESAIVAFVPTEFSALRAQVSRTQPAFGAREITEGFLQFNFTLGAHPAHAY